MADVVVAIKTLYESITASAFPGGTRPAMYFDEAPQTGAGGAQLRPGDYVVLRDRGRQPEYQSDHGATEFGTVVVEVYHTDLGTADLIAKAIKYGDGTPSQRRGLDFGDLAALTTPLAKIHLKRTNERRSLSGVSLSGANVYLVELTYEVAVQLLAS